MSVLIRGMEMPKEDEEIIIRINSDGTVMTEYALPISGTKAVSVPPHGRLIDADEMFTEFVIEGQRSKRYKIGEKWELNGEEILGVISRLPTIIPAEEGE